MYECHRDDDAIIQSIPVMQCVFIFFLLTEGMRIKDHRLFFIQKG